MIRVMEVSKYFDEVPVLKGVTTSFEQGKTNLVIGQSGSGKTVLMKCLVGLMGCDKGSIYYDDLEFTSTDFAARQIIRQQIGMLFQGGALFDSLTVEENIIFPLDMFSNLVREEKRERANFCLKRVNLENTNHLYPSELSGGMKKRVAIARAISNSPKYLFCDEPNSGLDPRTAIIIDNLISEITREFNITTIINTHDMNSVMEIGDNIAYLHEGRLVWQGSKDQVLSSENELLQGFIFASPFLQRLRAAALK